MRAARIAGIVFASLAGVLLIALLLAWWSFDPETYKTQLQDAFRDATGRELRLDGPLSLSFLPWLAVETGAAAVTNREGFGEEPFAALERARLGVRVWPLVSARRVELGPVRVDGLALNLQVARDGRNNWSDLVEQLRRKDEADPQAPRKSPGGELTVASVELRDAAVRFTDEEAGSRHAIERLDLTSGAFRAGAPVEIETALDLMRNDRRLGRIELRTRLDPGQAEQLVAADTTGTLALHRDGKPDLPVALTVAAISFASASRDIDVTGLEARIGDGRIDAELHVEQRDAGLELGGRWTLADTNARKWLAELGVTAPPTRDPQALSRLGASSDLAWSSARGLRLEQVDLRLDETQLAGRVVVDLERDSVQFELSGDAIDLDRYLPPPGDAASAPEPSPPPSADDAAGERTGLRALDARGSIGFDRLVVAGLPLQDATAQVRAGQGRLALDPLRARVFGGTAVTTLHCDLSGQLPEVRVEQQLADVDVAALLGQLFDVRPLQGRGTGKFSLATRGAGAEALFANLTGPFELTVGNGAVLGVDLWHEIERAVTAAQLQASAASSQGSGRTEFERLSARGTLGGRVLRNERLEFVTDFARVSGRGKVDYGRDALDLELTARMLKTPPGRLLGTRVSRIKGADIPLKVTGTLAEPKVRPDVSRLLESAAKDALREPVEEKIKEQLEKIFDF